MKHHICLLFFFTLLASFGLGQVAPPIPPELTTLITRYKAELQTAREPIRKH